MTNRNADERDFAVDPRRIGCIPLEGRYSVNYWATNILDCTEETLNDWIDRHGIPSKRMPGRMRVVDAVDLWQHLPFDGTEGATP
jgi:hypothetical protein